MAYITVSSDVEIDTSDVLEDIDDDDLCQEIERRKKAGVWYPTDCVLGDALSAKPDPDTLLWTPVSLAESVRGAFYARDASRMELLMTVLERKDGLLQ